MSQLAPVRRDSTTCDHCGAPLVADQRYCLSCGQPASPTRMSFLDAMQTQELAPRPVTHGTVVAAVPDDTAGPRWIKRYSPLFAVAAVLLLALIVGLLLGHWVTQSGKNQPQIVKLEGLGGLAAASQTGSTSESSGGEEKSSGEGEGSKPTAKQEKNEEAEARAEEAKHVAPPKAVKVSKTQLNKLVNSTGRRHQEELNKIGTSPIAVP